MIANYLSLLFHSLPRSLIYIHQWTSTSCNILSCCRQSLARAALRNPLSHHHPILYRQNAESHRNKASVIIDRVFYLRCWFWHSLSVKTAIDWNTVIGSLSICRGLFHERRAQQTVKPVFFFFLRQRARKWAQLKSTHTHTRCSSLELS